MCSRRGGTSEELGITLLKQLHDLSFMMSFVQNIMKSLATADDAKLAELETFIDAFLLKLKPRPLKMRTPKQRLGIIKKRRCALFKAGKGPPMTDQLERVAYAKFSSLWHEHFAYGVDKVEVEQVRGAGSA